MTRALFTGSIPALIRLSTNAVTASKRVFSTWIASLSGSAKRFGHFAENELDHV